MLPLIRSFTSRRLRQSLGCFGDRLSRLVGAILIASGMFLGCSGSGLAQNAEVAESTASSGAATEATVTFMHRNIVTFRDTIGTLTPEMRAKRAYDRLSALDDVILGYPIVSEYISLGDKNGITFTIGGYFLLGVSEGDVDPEQSQNVEQLSAEVRAKLEEALAAKLEQGRLPVLLRGIALTSVAALLLGSLVWLLWRLRSRAQDILTTLVTRSIERAARRGSEWRHYIYVIATRLVQIAAALAVLMLAYVWLTYSLGQFPATSPLGDRLGGNLIELVTELGSKAVMAIPDIAAVVVIFMFAQAFSRAASTLTHAAESGRMNVPFIQPDTARATRQILRIVIWGIALAIAYPYIPGSDSLAFQGLSVLFGLMISLGSTGVVSQMMSGMVLAYSRSLHPGDYVSIGDMEGVVLEVGAISTKLVSMSNEEITIPNSVLVENSIRNTSQRFPGSSSLISTKVTIGYDTPWRQVHAMLKMAADRTAGLGDTPQPYVFQQALTDFYVQYELFALAERSSERLAVLSALHGNIQDVFNEYGVQIMSPQYYEQPPEPLVVPREKWFTPPAHE